MGYPSGMSRFFLPLDANNSRSTIRNVEVSGPASDATRVAPAHFPCGDGRATRIGAATVAELVAITPASGYVAALPALVIGVVAGLVCFAAVELKGRLPLDDSLDVVGVHLVGASWGALLIGVFASPLVNAAGPKEASPRQDVRRSRWA